MCVDHVEAWREPLIQPLEHLGRLSPLWQQVRLSADQHDRVTAYQIAHARQKGARHVCHIDEQHCQDLLIAQWLQLGTQRLRRRHTNAQTLAPPLVRRTISGGREGVWRHGLGWW